MTKKIAMFMMAMMAGIGTLGFVSAAGNFGTTSVGFGLNEANSSGISGIAGAGQNRGKGLIDVFKNAINWVLSILGLITFCFLLWGGFNMVTAAGDDKKFDEGIKILKNSALGLGFIAVSWLLVSMIFWVIGTVSGSGGTPV